MVSRTAVGWALLFSVPPGVAVTGYVSMATARGTLSASAVLAGAVTAAVIFALVLGSQQVGSAEEPAVRERVD